MMITTSINDIIIIDKTKGISLDSHDTTLSQCRASAFNPTPTAQRRRSILGNAGNWNNNPEKQGSFTWKNRQATFLKHPETIFEFWQSDSWTKMRDSMTMVVDFLNGNHRCRFWVPCWLASLPWWNSIPWWLHPSLSEPWAGDVIHSSTITMYCWLCAVKYWHMIKLSH